MSANEQLGDDEMDAIMTAIRDAERCDGYTPECGDPCDGLDGCLDCLEQAAREIRKVVKDLL